MGVAFDFETGTAGSTQVTTAGTIGAASLTGAGGTCFIQNDNVWSGTRNIQLTVTTANTVTIARFNLTSNLTQSIGFGFRAPTVTSANLTLFSVRNSTGPALRINLDSVNGLRTGDTSGATANPLTIAPASALTAGNKYFLQLQVTAATATTGTITATLYNSSGTQIGTVSSSTYNLGTTNLIAVDAGIISTNPVNTQVSIDYLVANEATSTPVAVPGSNFSSSPGLSGSGTLSATTPGIGLSGSGILSASVSRSLSPALPAFGGSDSTSLVAASATTATISCPANVAVGDLLIGIFYDQFTGGTISSGLTGWTAITGMGVRTGGIYYLAVPDAATLASLPASWTVTTSGGGRLAFAIFRVTSADLTNPIDVAGSFATQTVTGVAIPSVTTQFSNSLLLAVSYWNNSTSTESVVTPDPAMTDGLQLGTPTTGNTSGIDIDWQQLTTPGATGTRSVSTSPASTTVSGVLVAIKSATNPTASLSGSGSLSAPGVAGYSDTAALSGSGSLVTTQFSASAAALSGSGALTVTSAPRPMQVLALGGVGSLVTDGGTPVQKHLAQSRIYTAHRGGSADWPEETLFSYQKAAAWSGSLALEISLWQSSDGVWVCSHDQTTGRVFNQNLDIPSNTWATLSTLTSINGGYPIARLEDILNPLATGTRVFYIDNKPQVNVSALLALLSTYGGASRFIAKGFYSSTTWADAATAAGYQTWGYWYATDVSAGALPQQSHWSLLGMDAVAPTLASWTAAEQYGKKVLAHIISNQTQYATAQQYRADGYMVSGVQEVVPQSPVATAALSGSGSLSAGTSASGSSTASLSGTGTLSTSSAVASSATAALSGQGILSASTASSGASPALLSGQGTLSVSVSPTIPSGSATLSGSGILNTSSIPLSASAVSLSGSGTLTSTVVGLTISALAGLSGSGALSTLSTIQLVTLAMLSGSGVLSVAGYVGQPRALWLQMDQEDTRWAVAAIAFRWLTEQSSARWALFMEE